MRVQGFRFVDDEEDGIKSRKRDRTVGRGAVGVGKCVSVESEVSGGVLRRGGVPGGTVGCYVHWGLSLGTSDRETRDVISIKTSID